MSGFQRMDRISITCDGQTIVGVILLASSNGKSLVLGFDAVIDGHVGMMPVLKGDDGVYRSIVSDIEVNIRRQHDVH